MKEVYIVIVNMQPVVSSLFAGECPVHLHIYSYDVDLLEDEQGNA
jgi:hypothetical protein